MQKKKRNGLWYPGLEKLILITFGYYLGILSLGYRTYPRLPAGSISYCVIRMKMGGFTVRTVFGLDSRGFTTFSHGQSKSSIVIMASLKKELEMSFFGGFRRME